jgi:NADH-quinone oxidoreductase subunit D
LPGGRVEDDIRVTEPYGAYKEIPVHIVTDTNADVYGRTVVRIREMQESINIIRFCINNLPDGPLTVRVPRRVPAGEVITRVEAPRGEDIHYIRSNGTDFPTGSGFVLNRGKLARR